VSYSLLVEGKCWACSSLGLNGHSLIFWVWIGYGIYLYVMKLDYNGEYRTSLINKCRTIRNWDNLQLRSRAINMKIYSNVSTRDVWQAKVFLMQTL
jgi:hypothetical protein